VAPENTLPSFDRARADGADYFELDVHATRDGVVVVIHDETLERTTDGTGLVRDHDYTELSRYDAGFRFAIDGGHTYRGRGIRVPTLEELIDAFPGVPLNIEIKQLDPPIERPVVELLERKNALDRTVLAAEDDRIMRRIRAAAPEVATSASYDEGREFFERAFGDRMAGYAPVARALQIPTAVGDVRLVTAETVAAAHGVGLEMHVWTINDEVEMASLLDLGVDGLMSDLPGVLVSVARRRSA